MRSNVAAPAVVHTVFDGKLYPSSALSNDQNHVAFSALFFCLKNLDESLFSEEMTCSRTKPSSECSSQPLVGCFCRGAPSLENRLLTFASEKRGHHAWDRCRLLRCQLRGGRCAWGEQRRGRGDGGAAYPSRGPEAQGKKKKKKKRGPNRGSKTMAVKSWGRGQTRHTKTDTVKWWLIPGRQAGRGAGR